MGTGVNVETDLNKIPLPDNNVNLEQVELKPSTEPMLHEGLHTEEDFQRIRDKKAAGEEPWVSAYQLLVESQFSQKTADTYPTEWIKRGVSGDENYMNAARGATIVYQQALRWKIEQDDEYAAKAVENLNKWVQTCVGVTGNTNLSLAAGLYGYEFAIAGELLRDYGGWDRTDFAAFQNWLLKVFYPANDDFLKRHHDTNALHYWANWCLCNIAAKMAIGIVTDRRDIYNEGIAHLQTGDTNGRLRRAIYHDYAPDYNFAQWQESGRDQGHTLMCVGLMGIICQLAWSQGDDFFAYDDNLFLRACEYAACCNYTNETVPYTTYIWQKQSQWGYPIPESTGSNSTLFFYEDRLYMVNHGFGYRDNLRNHTYSYAKNNLRAKIGKPFIASFEKESGRNIDFRFLSEKKEMIEDFRIDRENKCAVVLFEDRMMVAPFGSDSVKVHQWNVEECGKIIGILKRPFYLEDKNGSGFKKYNETLGDPTYYIYTDKGKVFDVDLSLNILKSFLFAEIGIYELLENGSAMVHYGNNVLLLNPEGVKKAALRVSSDWFSVGEKIYAFGSDRKRIVEVLGIEDL